jgi:hypothetical protein
MIQTMNQIKPRFWIKLLGTISAIAILMALFLAVLGTAAGTAEAGPIAGLVQSAGDPSGKFEGIITDTHCSAKHSAKVGLSAGDCTRVCVHGGEHFALVDGDKAYTLEGDPEDLKRLAGERATVKGTLTGTTISVASVTAGAAKTE